MGSSDHFDSSATVVKSKIPKAPRARATVAEQNTQTDIDAPVATKKIRKRRTTYDSYHRAIGESIYHIRKKKGMSQHMVAALCGIGVDAISVLENGRTSANIDTLRKVARVLDCSVLDFIPDRSFVDPIPVKTFTER
jgi:ribosome-binding protein aMBF1 (putative translation factor)